MPVPLPKRLLDAILGYYIDCGRVEAHAAIAAGSVLEGLRKELLSRLPESGENSGPGERCREERAKFAKESIHKIRVAYSDVAAILQKNMSGLMEFCIKNFASIFNLALGAELIRGFPSNDASSNMIEKAVNIQNISPYRLIDNQVFGLVTLFEECLAENEDSAARPQQPMPKSCHASETKTNRFAILSSKLNTSADKTIKIIRTAFSVMVKEAHLNIFKHNSDIFEGIQWFSLRDVDDNGNQNCLEYNYRCWRLPDLPPMGHNLSFPGCCPHWNCRSLLFPIPKTWHELKKLAVADKKIGLELNKIPPADRNLMGSFLPTNFSYENWLRDLPLYQQIDFLGEELYIKWKSGLSLSDMVDNKGKAIPIKALEALLNARREKARAEVAQKRFLWKDVYLDGGDNYAIPNLPPHIRYLLKSNSDSLLIHPFKIYQNIINHPQISEKQFISVIQKIPACSEIYSTNDNQISLVIQDVYDYELVLCTTDSCKSIYFESLSTIQKKKLRRLRRSPNVFP